MLIKIISGSFGHRPMLPNGKQSPYVIQVTPDHPPIEVDDTIAEELVKAGTAEIVGGKPEKAEPVKEEPKAKAKKGSKTEEVIP